MPSRSVFIVTETDDMSETAPKRSPNPLVIAIVLLLAATAADAEEGTMEQRHACTPDVFRLCSSFIPDRAAITACLERNRARLSPACQAVFAPPK